MDEPFLFHDPFMELGVCLQLVFLQLGVPIY